MLIGSLDMQYFKDSFRRVKSSKPISQGQWAKNDSSIIQRSQKKAKKVYTINNAQYQAKIWTQNQQVIIRPEKIKITPSI